MIEGCLPTDLPIVTEPDPFTDRLYMEAYLLSVAFDLVLSEARLLFGTWVGLADDVPGNLGLLVCSGVSEFGWRIDELGRPIPPHWWTVVGQRFLSSDELPRVESDPTPRMPGGPSPPMPDALGESRYRFALDLVPNAGIVIAFDSAKYFFVTQDGVEETSVYSTDRDAIWHAVLHWPVG